MLASSLSLLVLLTAHAFVAAHPHELHEAVPAQELSRRQLAANKRHATFRSNCGQAAVRYRAARKSKRSMLVKRQVASSSSAVASSSASSASPRYSTIQNTTCITTPEVTEGPYHVQQELIRTSITDGQDGIPLYLDIGVLDTTTCEPLTDAMVDLWHCNATGVYSGYTEAGSAGGGGGSGGTSASANGQSMAVPSGGKPSGSMSTGAMPSGGAGGDGAGGMTTALTDELNFLRGQYPTNSEGIVEFQTVYPGWYAGRTVHIHTAVLQGWQTLDNGTIAYGSGTVRHIGQIFFEDDLTAQVGALSPYTGITADRVLNANDNISQQESADGYNAIAEVEMLGSSIEDGLLAYITIGVDPTYSTQFTNANAYSPSGSSSLSASYASGKQFDASASATASASTSVVPNSGATRSLVTGLGSTLAGLALALLRC